MIQEDIVDDVDTDYKTADAEDNLSRPADTPNRDVNHQKSKTDLKKNHLALP